MNDAEFETMEPRVKRALRSIADATPVDDHWAVIADDLATGHSSTVETGRRRPPLRVLVAIAATIVVVVGTAAAVDRVRVSRETVRPASSAALIRRLLTRGPRHFLPTVPDSVGLVADQLDPGALAIRVFVDDTGRRLFWHANAFAAEQDPNDTTPWTTTTVEGVVVLRSSAGSPLGAVALWTKGGLHYGASIAGPTDGDLDAALPTLVHASAGAPPAAPPGFAGLSMLDELASGVGITSPDELPFSSYNVWSVPTSVVTADTLDLVSRQLTLLGGGRTGTSTRLEVNGRTAVVWSPEPVPADTSGSTPSIVFSPVAGTMVAISGLTSSTAPAELVALAAGVHEVDDATWSKAVFGGELVAAGEAAGVTWGAARSTATNESCVQVWPARQPTCVTLSTSSVRPLVFVGRLVGVVAPAGVDASIHAGPSNRSALALGTAHEIVVGTDRWRVWVLELPDDATSFTVSGMTADGSSFGSSTEQGISLVPDS